MSDHEYAMTLLDEGIVYEPDADDLELRSFEPSIRNGGPQ